MRSLRAEGSAEEMASAPAAKVVAFGVGSPTEECRCRKGETDDGAHPKRAECGSHFAGWRRHEHPQGKRGAKLRPVRGSAEQPTDPQFHSRYTMCNDSS